MSGSRRLTAVLAPSNLGLMPPAPGVEPGVRRMADALVGYGLLERLGIESFERLTPPHYQPAPDPVTGVRNASAIREYAERLSHAVDARLDRETFILVLGGDCSILLGAMLGLRRCGDYGLVFVDGHRDFQTPDTSGTGGAAGMDLALVSGIGPSSLTRFDDFDALVRDEATVVLGHRDVVTGVPDGSSAIADTRITLLDLAAVRRMGPATAAERAVEVVRASRAEGFWIHVDADVLDSAVMPCVDSPAPDGLTYQELRELLIPLLRNPLSAGLEVTIYDPDRDPDGEFGRGLTDFLTTCLGDAGLSARN